MALEVGVVLLDGVGRVRGRKGMREAVVFVVIGWGWRVDVDDGGRPARGGWAVDEALRVGRVGCREGGGVVRQDGVDAVVVHVGGCQEGDAGAAMLVVVPGDRSS